MKLDDCIEFLAEYGCSKNAVARLLDIRYEDFLGMCKAMPGVTWKPRGQTIGDKQARRKCRGKCSAAQRAAFTRAVRCSVAAKRVRAFGRMGTIKEHAERHGVVGYDAVLKRMHGGMPLEKALITPARNKTAALA